MTDVTVVIPTRDRACWVAQAVDSALRQEGVEVEVVVIDDASADETSAVLDAIGDDRLRVLHNPRQAGTARSRNRGLASARGDWVAFLDDDDLWAPDKLRRQLEAARSHRASFAYAAAIAVDAGGEGLEPDLPPPDPRTLARELVRRNVIPAGASNVVARRDVVERLGGFDEDLVHFPDWDLWLRLAVVTDAARCDEVLVAVRRHGANLFLVDHHRAPLVREYRQLMAKHAAVSRRLGVQPDPEVLHHWLAAGMRRRGRRGAAAAEYVRCAVACRSPGNLLLAGRTLLGEWAMRPPDAPDEPPPTPAWLERYRSGRPARARAS